MHRALAVAVFVCFKITATLSEEKLGAGVIDGHFDGAELEG